MVCNILCGEKGILMTTNTKGIVLAGGSGTRLYPLTQATSKQLLPIHDKPMVYYPISVLMLAKIKDILVITTPEDLPNFQRLLGDGSQFGIKLSYAVQPKPEGIAQAFLIGEEFIGNDRVALILGDNIFFGQAFSPILERARERDQGATIFGYQVKDPQRFGVVDFDVENGKLKKITKISEKPTHPTSNWAVTGLYFYDSSVVDIAKTIKPSARNELEITSINQEYLLRNQLYLETLGRGFAWLDTGTHEALLEASNFIHTIEKRQGFKIGCLEEIAFRNKWLDSISLLEISKKFKNTEYGSYLKDLLE